MKEKPKRNIPADEKIKLWVRAGGRCEICNEYLLKDRLTGKEFNFAQMAHNVGIGSGKSPRSKSSLSTNERNKAENLLLLCHKHHTMADTEKFKKIYTESRLNELKMNHEKRIHFLTKMKDDRVSVVLRMTNRIKQHSIAVSDQEVFLALDKCERRYPEYLLTTEKNVEINLVNLPNKVSNAYWKIGRQIIDDKIAKQIEPLVDDKVIRHISIFALARIPLLIYLGFRLGDKIPIDVYQKQRNKNEDWIWTKKSKPVSFSFEQIHKGNSQSKVVLLASISGKIHTRDLPQSVNTDYSIYEMIPSDVEPQRDIICNKETLMNFKDSYQRLMRVIEKRHPECKDILLFPALPVSAAVYCGRELLKDTSPQLTIYDKENNKYVKTFSINNIKQ